MRLKALVLSVGGALVLASSALATVTIYRNDFSSSARVREFLKQGAGQCSRRSAGAQMTITVGSGTVACAFRSPVVGSSLQMTVFSGLAQGTPAAIRSQVGTGIALRSGGRTFYSLGVYQGRKRWLLSRSAGGEATTIQQGKLASIRSIGRVNRLTLRTFGNQIVGAINGKTVVSYQDQAGGEVNGKEAAVVVFSSRSAKGAVARFDNVAIQVPDPK